MKQLVSIAAALLVGIGLGYLLFGGRFGAPRGGARPQAAGNAGRAPGSDPVSGPRGPSDTMKARGGPSGTQAGSLLRSVRERNVQLASENKRLAGRLSALEQDLVFARGRPMGWPADIPTRLTREAVVAAVNQALRESGIDGEITDKDCKEYPCVLSGSAKGQVTSEQFKRILGTKALRTYKDDHAQTSITNRSGHDSLGRPWVRSHFAIALMKSGPGGTELDVKRTVYRLRQLLDATTGQ